MAVEGRAGWVADINDLQTTGIVSDVYGVAIGGEGDAKGKAGGVVGGGQGWASRVADINDLQTAGIISNESGVAIGREGDVACTGGVEGGGE